MKIESDMMTDEVLERFFDKFEVGDEDECWEWQASRSGGGRNNGYGNFTVTREVKGAIAHRIAYVIEHGEDLDDDMEVMHTCDNSGCVNANHLEAGTHAENMKLAGERGRLPRGEKHHYSVLTRELVKIMRTEKQNGERCIDIAERYGIGYKTVWHMLAGKTWRHV